VCPSIGSWGLAYRCRFQRLGSVPVGPVPDSDAGRWRLLSRQLLAAHAVPIRSSPLLPLARPAFRTRRRGEGPAETGDGEPVVERGPGAAPCGRLPVSVAAGWVFLPFPTRAGESVRGTTAWSWVKRIGRDAGIGDITTHQLRHTSLTVALYRTADLRSVMVFARHNRPETTAGYTRTTRDQLKKVSEALDFDGPLDAEDSPVPLPVQFQWYLEETAGVPRSPPGSTQGNWRAFWNGLPSVAAPSRTSQSRTLRRAHHQGRRFNEGSECRSSSGSNTGAHIPICPSRQRSDPQKKGGRGLGLVGLFPHGGIRL
jgi:hypothetical protein